jgi:thioredoxin 1
MRGDPAAGGPSGLRDRPCEDIMTHKVTDSSFKTDVLDSSEPVVVDFWAEWCGPCRMIAPALDEISKELEGKVKIVKMNVDENQQVPGQFGIRSIPTLMIFKGGKLAAQKVGAASKGDLSKWIHSAL